MKILVTGATGFVGRALIEHLALSYPEVVGTSRQTETSLASLNQALPENATVFSAPDFSDEAWLSILDGVDVVIHCAARVHQINESSEDPLAEFRRVNRDGTGQLAEYAVRSGVRRFIFLSSVKVHGEQTLPGRPFHPEDTPAPASDYGISKLEAERVLIQKADSGGMDWIVVRPPLVYGSHAKGNLGLLEKAARLRLPLPFGGIENRRSLVSVSNLVRFLESCVSVAKANEVYLVSDSRAVSTAEIYDAICVAAGTRTRSFKLPASLNSLLLALLKRADLYQRLAGSLEVDISKSIRLSSWKPTDFGF